MNPIWVHDDPKTTHIWDLYDPRRHTRRFTFDLQGFWVSNYRKHLLFNRVPPTAMHDMKPLNFAIVLRFAKNNARLHGNYYVIPTHWSLTRGWYLHGTPTKPTSDLKMTRAWKLDDSHVCFFRRLINQFLIRPRWAQWWFKYEIKIRPKWLQGAWRVKSRWAQYDPKLTQTWNWWPQARPRPRVV